MKDADHIMDFEDYLKRYGTLIYRIRGSSMLPMLRQNSDLVAVTRKTPERCRKYDVVLYRRKTGQYVLHRIIEVREKDYVLLGDHCIGKEYGITDDDILGVLQEYIRDGKRISAHSPQCRLYARTRVLSYPLRKGCYLLRSCLSRSRSLRRLLKKLKY